MAAERYPTIKVEQQATIIPVWPSIEQDATVKSPKSDPGAGEGDGSSPVSTFTTTSPSPVAVGDNAALPRSVTLAAPAKFRGQHPPGLWESLKQEIRHLYIDEELPLKEVREIMMRKGFVATEKMYKDKFAKWGFNKNNRKKDVAKIVSHQKQRKVAGKSTVYYRNGKVVNLESYIKRAKLSPEDLLEAAEEENLPSYVRSRTPPPQSANPKPDYIQPLGYYNVRDLLFKCFRHLGARADSVLDKDSALAAYTNYPTTDLYFTIRNLRDAAWLFKEDRTREGGVLVRRAFDHLHVLVEDPNPWALCDLLMFQMGVLQYGHQTLIWKFLADYAATGKGPLEWLHNVFKALHEFFENYPIETCLEFLAEQVGVIYPLMVVQGTKKNMQLFLQGVVNSKSRHHYHIQPVRRFTLAIESQSLPRAKDVLEPENPLFRFHELFTIGLESGWRDERCLSLATDLYKSETDLNSRRLSLRALAYYHMGRCRPESPQMAAANPRYGYAKQYMQQALDLAPHATFGGLSGGALREIWEDSKLLEQWHLEDGDTAAAQALVENRQDALTRFIGSLDIPARASSPAWSAVTAQSPAAFSSGQGQSPVPWSPGQSPVAWSSAAASPPPRSPLLS
ncbi:hypothetical protein E8E14_014827 [Neopestalotiopsis sp. 37M]|nr:hypothetical protein E8E14_014827 [Neopestalotiopsis sp. 37M]